MKQKTNNMMCLSSDSFCLIAPHIWNHSSYFTWINQPIALTCSLLLLVVIADNIDVDYVLVTFLIARHYQKISESELYQFSLQILVLFILGGCEFNYQIFVTRAYPDFVAVHGRVQTSENWVRGLSPQLTSFDPFVNYIAVIVVNFLILLLFSSFSRFA